MAGVISGGRLTLVLGGSGSGKSLWAESLVGNGSSEVIYLATLMAADPESRMKIAAHRKRRPSRWLTIEVREGLSDVVGSMPPTGVILLDSITCYVAERLDGVEARVAEIENCLRGWIREGRSVVVVSDEVGASVVPERKSARLFRDALGQCNQRVAALADDVYLVVAGLPVKLK